MAVSNKIIISYIFIDPPPTGAAMLKFSPFLPAVICQGKRAKKVPTFSLKPDPLSAGTVRQGDTATFSVSAGSTATVCDLKKAVYAAANRANQLKKESGAAEVVLDVQIPEVRPALNSSTTGLFFTAPSQKPLYGRSTPRSLAFEKATTYAALSGYRYDRFKKVTESPATLLLNPCAGVDNKAFEVGNIIAKCVSDARNLGNLRHDEGTPASIEDWIRRNVAGKYNIRLKHAIVGDALEKAGLNMLYAVGKGASVAPRMLVLEYIGAPSSKTATALVGKGVTFDCGGLNVKPFGSMETMHLDKMGAVAVVNAIKGIAELKLPVNVVASVGLVENAIGPASYHPSTILRSLDGKTVEVTNTDAEGRLVLGDLLTFVQKKARLSKNITSIIDLATLTGAIVAALGDRRAGIFSNSSGLAKDLIHAGDRVDELLWPMPIGDEHVEMMKGTLSDLTNCRVKREAGACTAAAFLSAFVDKRVQWAHVDIAGPAMGEFEKAANLAGPPGFGVQLLIDYFRHL